MRYSRMVRRQIRHHLQKIKHVVDVVATVSAPTNMNTTVYQPLLAAGVDNPTLGVPADIASRSAIAAMYLELSFISAVDHVTSPGTYQTFNWIVFYNPQAGLPLIDPRSVGSNAGKNYVFSSGHVTVDATVGHKTIKYLVRIPRKYQRLMTSDIIQMAIATDLNNGNTDAVKIRCIYKEIRG